jgi:hypothetical protein
LASRRIAPTPLSASGSRSIGPFSAWGSRQAWATIEDLLDRRYRFWNFYSYVVCYAWAPKPIQIVAVVHGARQLASFFESRPSPEQTS